MQVISSSPDRGSETVLSPRASVRGSGAVGPTRPDGSLLPTPRALTVEEPTSLYPAKRRLVGFFEPGGVFAPACDRRKGKQRWRKSPLTETGASGDSASIAAGNSPAASRSRTGTGVP